MGDLEKRKRIVQRLRPIDDIFFQKLMEDPLVCEESLRVIVGDPGLTIESVIPQKSVRSLQGRSIVLDALCRRTDGSFYNLEVQKADNDDHLRRARYYDSCITANVTDPGTDFRNVPDVCIVYVSRFDIFKEDRTIYHVYPTIQESGTRVDNGLTHIFVNTKVDDGSEVALLMRCYESEWVDSPKFPRLSSRVRSFKEQKEGIETMSDLLEEYANEMKNEGKAESIILMLESGLSYEDVARILKMSVDKVRELESLVMA